ncbi:hypothetical protein CAC42_2361 [Sphaceloma murrayae]|uniref:Conserved oligomeric Golgi complex subunit 8 n=1 Tax=Sphaceloma murrayae TaxID=2082308 RepID=A0A2K1QJR3_9PEZI|nr:hypothetical protein CAC42_2361 [Sphaceloma murrayae]
MTTAADHLNKLPDLLASLSKQSSKIRSSVNTVEVSINDFAQKYERNTENEILDRRKTASLLTRNAERVGNIMELPSLLESTVNTSAAAAGGTAAGSAAVSSGGLLGYASALDIHAHVKRLKLLYPTSGLVASVGLQADGEISNMITVLITTLQTPALKLALAMRTIGWLRRVAPELSNRHRGQGGFGDRAPDASLRHDANEEGALGSLFLVCRLATLRRTLEALDPLKQLADQETEKRRSLESTATDGWTGGVQSERYLKRFIEIFREQSFAIVSMYKSVFPVALPTPVTGDAEHQHDSNVTQRGLDSAPSGHSLLEERASALGAFVPVLVDMISEDIKKYLPNVSDRSSRDSLLSQMLFCAGSLGRLGADFGLALALIEEDVQLSTERFTEPEWVVAMNKHRVQASRLEVLASGVGTGRKGSLQPDSRSQSPSIAAR